MDLRHLAQLTREAAKHMLLYRYGLLLQHRPGSEAVQGSPGIAAMLRTLPRISLDNDQSPHPWLIFKESLQRKTTKKLVSFPAGSEHCISLGSTQAKELTGNEEKVNHLSIPQTPRAYVTIYTGQRLCARTGPRLPPDPHNNSPVEVSS